MKNTKKTSHKTSKTGLQECHGDLCGHINICYKRSPNDLFVCTRAIGHKGNHVACDGGDIHNLAIWRNAAKDNVIEEDHILDDAPVNIEEETATE